MPNSGISKIIENPILLGAIRPAVVHGAVSDLGGFNPLSPLKSTWFALIEGIAAL
jgi:hypothetical protein